MYELLFKYGLDCSLIEDALHVPPEYADLFALFERILLCRRRAATVLSPRFRARMKLPRDVAVVLARAIWAHRRVY